MALFIGQDQHLRRTGDHVDAHLAEHQTLGGRDIGVAGPDDLGDRRNGCSTVGERGNRLGAANAVDLIDAGKLRGGEHEGRELALRRGHDHRQPRRRRRLSPAPHS